MSFERFLSLDIRDVILDLLENGGVDGNNENRLSFNNGLTAVDTKRGTTTPQARSIDFKWSKNQDPLLLIDMGDSGVINTDLLTNDYELTPEIYDCEIFFVLKFPTEELQNYCENWIESIIGVLHGYCDSNITWIYVTDIEKPDLYNEKSEVLKGGVVKLQIRIN